MARNKNDIAVDGLALGLDQSDEISQMQDRLGTKLVDIAVPAK